ncbi:MAG: methylmalonyl Co-A mutase-associated GTPase MeaB [Planctomycetota bacterium]
MTRVRRREFDVATIAEGVRSGNRAQLGRAITLIESQLPKHQPLAEDLLTRLLPHSGNSQRVGITGVPGVGKSTFIEALGTLLTSRGHRVAVLAVDPSSGVTGGSILADKTRMMTLAADENAFIRPSPSSGTLGGVARKTRETMLVCEAAGYDVVLVETVGVGQSETVVAGMTDVFLALMLPNAGDEMQGIKRGLLELVDLIAVNKADEDNMTAARRAVQEYINAMHYTRSASHAKRGGPAMPPVLTCSALERRGIAEVWAAVEQRIGAMRDSGALAERRRDQALQWTEALIQEGLQRLLHNHEGARKVRRDVESAVRAGELPASVAAQRVLDAFAVDLCEASAHSDHGSAKSAKSATSVSGARADHGS